MILKSEKPRVFEELEELEERVLSGDKKATKRGSTPRALHVLTP